MAEPYKDVFDLITGWWVVGLFTKKQTNMSGGRGLGNNEFQVKSSVKTNIRTELLWLKKGVGPLFSPHPLPACERIYSTLGEHYGFTDLLYSSGSKQESAYAVLDT